MERPKHLPDFNNPPLDEVVIGVQFAPLRGYSSVYAADVWGLFKDQFPVVQEQAPLEPAFEMFGGSNPSPGISFRFGHGPVHGRLWFISSDDSHLIQFQEDRFLLNWRRRPAGNDYPRFESIFNAYAAYLSQLDAYVAKKFDAPLDLNQAELTYYNLIPVDDYSDIGRWLDFINVEKFSPENVSTAFTEVVSAADGRPVARLIHELQSAVSVDGKQKAFKLSITFRGKPLGGGAQDYLDFLFEGRKRVVSRFSEMTTSISSEKWGRK